MLMQDIKKEKIKWFLIAVLGTDTIQFISNHTIIIYGFFMFIAGVAFRKETPIKAFLLYTMTMVAFASALANQYLIIPCAALIIYFGWKSVPYLFLSLVFLICNADGLALRKMQISSEKLHEVLRILGDGGIMYALIAWTLFVYIFIYMVQMLKNMKSNNVG